MEALGLDIQMPIDRLRHAIKDVGIDPANVSRFLQGEDTKIMAVDRRLWDLALAACTFVPLYPSATRQVERFRVFCYAYGLAARDQVELLEVTVQRIGRMWRVLVDNADRDPHASLVRNGHAEFWQGVERHVRDRAGTWREMLSPG